MNEPRAVAILAWPHLDDLEREVARLDPAPRETPVPLPSAWR